MSAVPEVENASLGIGWDNGLMGRLLMVTVDRPVLGVFVCASVRVMAGVVMWVVRMVRLGVLVVLAAADVASSRGRRMVAVVRDNRTGVVRLQLVRVDVDFLLDVVPVLTATVDLLVLLVRPDHERTVWSTFQMVMGIDPLTDDVVGVMVLLFCGRLLASRRGAGRITGRSGMLLTPGSLVLVQVAQGVILVLHQSLMVFVLWCLRMVLFSRWRISSYFETFGLLTGLLGVLHRGRWNAAIAKRYT